MRLALSIEPVYRISTALRTISNRDSENPSKLVFRNEHHRRGCSLFSIDIQFAKVEVAGSNPVSRSFPPPTWPLSSRVLPPSYRVKVTTLIRRLHSGIGNTRRYGIACTAAAVHACFDLLDLTQRTTFISLRCVMIASRNGVRPQRSAKYSYERIIHSTKCDFQIDSVSSGSGRLGCPMR